MIIQMNIIEGEPDCTKYFIFFAFEKSIQSCPTICHLSSSEARQASLSMGFSRQEYESGLPCPSPRDLPNPGIEPASLTSLALAGRFFTISATWEAHFIFTFYLFMYLFIFGRATHLWDFNSPTRELNEPRNEPGPSAKTI